MASVFLASASAAVGADNMVALCGLVSLCASLVAGAAEKHTYSRQPSTSSLKDDADIKENSKPFNVVDEIVSDFRRSMSTIVDIWDSRLLRSAFLYALFYSVIMGIKTIEKRSAARRNGLSRESYASFMGENQICKLL